MTENQQVPENPQVPEEAMPPGFEQPDDSTLSDRKRRIVIANMYFWHLVAVFLIPVAVILRAGRWSMRTLVCHHRGWEFGGF